MTLDRNEFSESSESLVTGEHDPQELEAALAARAQGWLHPDADVFVALAVDQNADVPRSGTGWELRDGELYLTFPDSCRELLDSYWQGVAESCGSTDERA